VTTPILIFSDHPACPTGLARITRDLAFRIHHEMKGEVDVATLGYGAAGSIHLPFHQYTWHQNDYFLPLELPQVWHDFCGDDPGILLTIGDIQRFLQLADFGMCTDRPFGDWIRVMRSSGKLRLWGYFPIDAHGIDGKLGPQLAHTLTHYDRRLVPSKWAQEIVKKTLPDLQCDVLPHGIDTSVFKHREGAIDKFIEIAKPYAKWPQGLIPPLEEDALKVGIVATNQTRKDWGLGIEVVARLRKTRRVFLWAHVDRVRTEAWSLLELLSDFGLLDCTVITSGNMTDEQMSWCYSAMDCSLAIGRGEGHSFANYESICSATPCFASSYGAQSDWMDKEHLIDPDFMRLEGPLNLYRPVFSAETWVKAIEDNLGKMMRYPHELKWESLWERFATWIREGIK